MKRITLILLLMAFSGSNAQRLEMREVPEAVMIAFRKTNPGFTGNPQWRKDKECFQAQCMVNKNKKTFTYSKSGTPIVNDGKVALSVLPPAVKDYLDKNYPNAPVDKVLKIMKPDKSITYNVEVSGTDLFFDSNGKFLKSRKTI